jgi:hypothetical protein
MYINISQQFEFCRYITYLLAMLTLLFFGYYRGYTRVYTWFVRDIKKPVLGRGFFCIA